MLLAAVYAYLTENMDADQLSDVRQELGLVEPELNRVEQAESLPPSPVEERASIAQLYGDVAVG